MTSYVAFLRAINVGGHIVKMVDLRQHFAAAGFANVETYIQSGNVIFASESDDTGALERHIETHLENILGYAVATFLRTFPELEAVAAHQPFPAAEFEAGASLYIAFLKEEPAAEIQNKILAFTNEVDAFHVRGRELYWLGRKQQMQSTFSGALLEKTLGGPATVRNITTVRKLVAKYRTPNL
ncbi:MAG TPA: DUF1697 domain-containing protein [Chloroflexota bacterium]|nr:DUF1697 domain-containing protein [Chloroflexota bacterium]HUM71864.1 DUF1697 domain-containing protein [Chloroflexota bacterium]